MKKPLEGIRILDFTQFLSGPFCTMILADMGAEVIKIERPLTGDLTRYSPLKLKKDKISTYFIGCNRNKKSVLMNLKDRRQKELFLQLAKDADVIIENFKPGTMEKFGCGYDVLKQINPKLVYTAISGYGQNGPLKHKGGLDLVVQAESGLMSITGESENALTRCGISISDISSGVWGAVGTLGALYSAQETGKGQYVDISMLDVTIAMMEYQFTRYFVDKQIPKPIGNHHPAGAPFSEFPTKDNGKVIICCPADEQWQRLCDALGHSEWKADERFMTTSSRKDYEDELITILSRVTRTYETDELIHVLNQHGIVNGQINNIEQAINSPQVKARNMIVNVKYPGARVLKTIGCPIKFSEFNQETMYTATPLGANTFDILSKYTDVKNLHEIYDPIMIDVEKSVKNKFEH